MKFRQRGVLGVVIPALLASIAGFVAAPGSGMVLTAEPERESAGTSSVRPATVEDLFAADRAFAEAARAEGLEGWMSYMTSDAARMPAFGTGFTSGDAAIRAMDGPLLDSGEVLLTWEPAHGHVFDDGRTGFTTGPYRVLRRADDAVVGRGTYLSYWRLTDDGWRVAFDTGVAAPPE